MNGSGDFAFHSSHSESFFLPADESPVQTGCESGRSGGKNYTLDNGKNKEALEQRIIPVKMRRKKEREALPSKIKPPVYSDFGFRDQPVPLNDIKLLRAALSLALIQILIHPGQNFLRRNFPGRPAA